MISVDYVNIWKNNLSKSEPWWIWVTLGVFTCSPLFHPLDLFHWDCLNKYAEEMPANTAPAGYSCPSCNVCIFPQENMVAPVAEKLRDYLTEVNWGRNGLGLPVVGFCFGFGCTCPYSFTGAVTVVCKTALRVVLLWFIEETFQSNLFLFLCVLFSIYYLQIDDNKSIEILLLYSKNKSCTYYFKEIKDKEVSLENFGFHFWVNA